MPRSPHGVVELQERDTRQTLVPRVALPSQSPVYLLTFLCQKPFFDTGQSIYQVPKRIYSVKKHVLVGFSGEATSPKGDTRKCQVPKIIYSVKKHVSVA